MKLMSRVGMVVEVDAERGLLVNGRPPDSLDALGDGWFRASRIFCRVVRPKRASSQRKRKKALTAATRKFKFSFNFRQG